MRPEDFPIVDVPQFCRRCDRMVHLHAVSIQGLGQFCSRTCADLYQQTAPIERNELSEKVSA